MGSETDTIPEGTKWLIATRFRRGVHLYRVVRETKTRVTTKSGIVFYKKNGLRVGDASYQFASRQYVRPATPQDRDQVKKEQQLYRLRIDLEKAVAALTWEDVDKAQRALDVLNPA